MSEENVSTGTQETEVRSETVAEKPASKEESISNDDRLKMIEELNARSDKLEAEEKAFRDDQEMQKKVEEAQKRYNESLKKSTERKEQVRSEDKPSKVQEDNSRVDSSIDDDVTNRMFSSENRVASRHQETGPGLCKYTATELRNMEPRDRLKILAPVVRHAVESGKLGGKHGGDKFMSSDDQAMVIWDEVGKFLGQKKA